MKRALEALQGFGRNLNELARQGKLDPVVGRAKEIGHAARVLSRRTKNNPVLIGEAGVGKTAVAEGLAQMIVAKKVPEFLQDKTVFSLELGSILGGSKYRGELEERLQEIIEAVRDCPQMILFIDEMQMLMNGGELNGKRFLSWETIRYFTGYHSPISRRGYGFDKPEKPEELLVV